MLLLLPGMTQTYVWPDDAQYCTCPQTVFQISLDVDVHVAQQCRGKLATGLRKELRARRAAYPRLARASGPVGTTRRPRLLGSHFNWKSSILHNFEIQAFGGGIT